MSGLGDLLGAYGSGSESEEAQDNRGDHENNLDLSHLTEAAAPQPAPQTEPSASQLPINSSIPAEEHAQQQQPPANAQQQPPASPENTLQHPDPGSLPPELANPPEGQCDPAIQERVARWLHLQSQGRYLTDQLRSSRDYRNPEFFLKMVEYWEIDQHGTAFAPEVYDPKSLLPEDTIQALQKQWQEEEVRRRTTRATTGRIDFASGGVQMQQHAQGTDPKSIAAAAVAAAQANAAALAAAARGRR